MIMLMRTTGAAAKTMMTMMRVCPASGAEHSRQKLQIVHSTEGLIILLTPAVTFPFSH